MTPLLDRTIGDYLKALSSSTPAPGGGSVAGVVGVLAAGLGQMVINLTRKDEQGHPLDTTYDSLKVAINLLVEAAQVDETAYSGYLQASRLPKSTPEEKATRRDAMQSAMVNAAEVPLGLAGHALSVLDNLEPVMRHGTTHALSDAAIGVSLAQASVTAALANVRANLPYIKDEGISADLKSRADSIEARATEQAALLLQIPSTR
jgi:formiminotetrahydrofolate cyclodeaminase